MKYSYGGEIPDENVFDMVTEEEDGIHLAVSTDNIILSQQEAFELGSRLIEVAGRKPTDATEYGEPTGTDDDLLSEALIKAARRHVDADKEPK